MAEPTTAVTDWALSLLGLFLGLRLWRVVEPPSTARRLWAGSFLAVFPAALAGGVTHALAPAFLPELRFHLWSVTFVSLGLSSLLLAAGAVYAALPRRWRAPALALLVLRFAVYLPLVLTRRELRWAAYDGALTLVVLLGLAIHARARRDLVRPLLAAIALTLVGGVIQGARLAPHPQFNHNDLFHVIQMAGLALFHRAGRRLEDHP